MLLYYSSSGIGMGLVPANMFEICPGTLSLLAVQCLVASSFIALLLNEGLASLDMLSEVSLALSLQE
jgi:hypothetical protein